MFGVRLIGAILFFSGSVGISIFRNDLFERRYQIIRESGRILSCLNQKIVFHRIPVECILEELKDEGMVEWNLILNQLTAGMKTGKKDLKNAYEDAIDAYENKIGLDRDEHTFLLGIRNVLLSYDKAEVSMELECLRREQEMIENSLHTKRKEMKKVSMALGVAGGIMGVILLC